MPRGKPYFLQRMQVMQAVPGFRDVHAYPRAHLSLTRAGVRVPVSYRKTWHDGFGARGWKLDVSRRDPAIIASTRVTGERIPTSVLVHDLLDHLLSGFDASGHRAEAMALVQLGKRTGSDIGGDYLQMVREDVRHGHVNGEPLSAFLPAALLADMPVDRRADGRELMQALQTRLGEAELERRLVRHFFRLGERGKGHAQDSWRLLGLKTSRRRLIGLALQRVLSAVDRRVEDRGVEQLQAVFIVGNEQCALEVERGDAFGLRKRYSSRVGEAWPSD